MNSVYDIFCHVPTVENIKYSIDPHAYKGNSTKEGNSQKQIKKRRLKNKNKKTHRKNK